MNEIILVMLMFIMSGCCTFNFAMNHTEGSATDLVDEEATNTPTTSNSATLPIGNPLKR